MTDRLQKIISARGITSRRKAEEWIRDGRVSVNGKTASVGDCANPENDRIEIDGKPLPAEQERVYLMLNKPRGYVTTLADEKGRPNAASLVSDCGYRVYPIGRLDMDSEGLLLFTNDGSFANEVMHPKLEVEKTYEVWVNGFNKDALSRVREPVVLDGYRIRSPKVQLLSFRDQKAKLEITIHEGRNRQIRRMCEMAGMQVSRLKRIREGGLSLSDLPEGKWRFLTEDERQKI